MMILMIAYSTDDDFPKSKNIMVMQFQMWVAKVQSKANEPYLTVETMSNRYRNKSKEISMVILKRSNLSQLRSANA
jgi:hypothetical protein